MAKLTKAQKESADAVADYVRDLFDKYKQRDERNPHLPSDLLAIADIEREIVEETEYLVDAVRELLEDHLGFVIWPK